MAKDKQRMEVFAHLDGDVSIVVALDVDAGSDGRGYINVMFTKEQYEDLKVEVEKQRKDKQFKK